MMPATSLDLSGERLTATYRVRGDEPTARAVADRLRVEQTIEFPLDLIADDDIRHQVVAQLTDLRADGDDHHLLDISFAVEVTGFQMPQLLNMLFGNIGLQPDVRLVDVAWPDAILEGFPGPRFGVAGIRDLVGAHDRAMVATALKPMGLPLSEMARMAGDFAAAGLDLIKDDHGLANQPFALFRERVERCGAAIAQANRLEGTRAMYLPSLNVPADEMADAVRFAVAAGAGGLMVLPGLHGFDSVRAMADDDGVRLPLMAHPSLLGSFVVAPDSGIDHHLVFGTLARLAGADVSVFPNAGGRFSFSQAACDAIAAALTGPLGALAPALPAPAGGMSLAQVPDMVAAYGTDVVLLIGGELHRGDRRERATRLRQAVEAAGSAGSAVRR